MLRVSPSPFVLAVAGILSALGLGLPTPASAELALLPGAQRPTYANLASFDLAKGRSPAAPLLQGSDGNYYGTSMAGGAYDAGTVFRMTPQGRITVLHSFIQDGVDGFQPVAPLVQDREGSLWGTTEMGGNVFSGVVFRLSATTGYKVMHAFQGAPNDCSQSDAPLVQAVDGSLVGTTSFGGSFNKGCVFRIAPGGAYSVLHSFGGPDGALPQWGLTLASDGNLYGATNQGGDANAGTIYRIDTSGRFTLLASLQPGVHGASPSRLVQARNGLLYGAAAFGGPSTGGTIFSVSLSGAIAVLRPFEQGTPEGDYPTGIIQAGDGNFYGTTANFGSDQLGTVFRVTPTGALTVLHKFSPGSVAYPEDGAQPYSPPIQDRSGALVGTTSAGGVPGVVPGYGMVYRLRIGTTAH